MTDTREHRPGEGNTQRKPLVSCSRGPDGKLRWYVVDSGLDGAGTLKALRAAHKKYEKSRKVDTADRLKRLLRAEAQLAKARRAEPSRDLTREKARIGGWRLDLAGN